MTIRQTIALLTVATASFSTALFGQAPPLNSGSIEVIKHQVERNAKVKILQALRYTALNVDFDQMPARDAFEYFGTALGINLIGRYSDDALGFGIDPEAPITLNLIEMPAGDVLQLMLEQCSTRTDACTWQIRSSYMEVGTKSRLAVAEAQVLRVYSISDLVRKAPNFDDAPSLRLEEIYGDYWHDPYLYGRGGTNE